MTYRPFAECVTYIELEEIHWHMSPFGIVIQAKATVRVYFTFGDMFETFVRSQDFDPYGMRVPLTMYHDGIPFPPMPAWYHRPPTPVRPQDTYTRSSSDGRHVSETIRADPVHIISPTHSPESTPSWRLSDGDSSSFSRTDTEDRS